MGSPLQSMVQNGAGNAIYPVTLTIVGPGTTTKNTGTGFYSPESRKYDFKTFYGLLKTKGFVIYPGKVSKASAFRIGNIGDVYPVDMERLVKAIEDSMFWKD